MKTPLCGEFPSQQSTARAVYINVELSPVSSTGWATSQSNAAIWLERILSGRLAFEMLESAGSLPKTSQRSERVSEATLTA